MPKSIIAISWLSISDVTEELDSLKWVCHSWLDEHARFDFVEDSRGAHEYKILKNGLLLPWKSDLWSMLWKVLEIGEVSDPQETSFD